jgi:hypothetical protein
MAVLLSGANGSLYFSCGVHGTSGKIQGFFTAFRMTIVGYTGTKTGISPPDTFDSCVSYIVRIVETPGSVTALRVWRLPYTGIKSEAAEQVTAPAE